MPKKCEQENPNIRVRLHTPETNWHPHYDKTFNFKERTEWEVFAHTVTSLLHTFSYGNVRLMLGYWLDLLNAAPRELRTAFVQGIVEGRGLEVRNAPDEPNTIEIHLVPRYEPLQGPKETEGGLVIPSQGESANLILPGDPRFRR